MKSNTTFLIICLSLLCGCALPQKYRQNSLPTTAFEAKENREIKKVRLQYSMLPPLESYDDFNRPEWLESMGESELRDGFSGKTTFEFNDIHEVPYLLEVTVREGELRVGREVWACFAFAFSLGLYPCTITYSHTIEATLHRPDGSKKKYEIDGSTQQILQVLNVFSSDSSPYTQRSAELRKRKIRSYEELRRRIESDL